MIYKYTKIGILCTALISGLALSGCGEQGGGDANSSGAKSATEKSAQPAARSDLPVKKLVITGNDQMKYDLTKLEAKAGQQIELVFKNAGTMPKQSMGHNWCLLKQGTDGQAFLEPGFAFAGNEYIAPEVADQVIVRTKILGPGEEETLTFVAPAEAGDYPYICTFPGHFSAGMQGILQITE
ncbi:MAG: plastocyanin/azurin family copper-binding protein [Chthoniobacterales bacterium]